MCYSLEFVRSRRTRCTGSHRVHLSTCRSRGFDISFDLEEEKENIESIDMVKHIQMKVEEIDVRFVLSYLNLTSLKFS